MTKARDLADFIATGTLADGSLEIADISGLQTELDNISVTSGSLTKTFTSGESANITLNQSLTAPPVLSVTKEIPQTGISSKGAWDVATDGANYELHDTAYDTTLTSITPYNYSSGTSETQADINADVGTPISIAFSDDGLKYFVLDLSSTVYEYALSTAYDVDTQTLTTSFDASTQVTTGFVLRFKPDGTKMYVGDSTTTIYQYSLSTAWDISTASYDSKSYDATTQITATRGLAFNPDGSDMYIGDRSGTTTKVFQYSLSTPWDVSTASYASKTVTLTTNWIIGGLDISPLGTTLLVGRETHDDIVSFDIATAWDISTLNTAGTIIESTSLANTNGVGLSVDGSKIAFTGNASGNLARVGALSFTPDTPRLTLGTGSFASTDVGKTIEANSGKFVLTNADGSYVETEAPTSYDQVAAGDWSMYALTFDGTDGVKIGVLQRDYDIANASYDDVSLDISSQESVLQDITFNNDGTKMYIVGSNDDEINEYSLSTAFDLSTASHTAQFSVASQDTVPVGVEFSSNGTKMIIAAYGNDAVLGYNLSTAFDISSASYASESFSIQNEDTYISGVRFNLDGTKMYISGSSSASIHQYSLSTAYDVTSASYDSVSFDVSSQAGGPQGFTFNADGTKLFVADINSAFVYQYSLSTSFDISTMTYDSVSFDLSSQESSPRGLSFNNDGTKMFIAARNNLDILQYSTGFIFTPTSQYHPTVTKVGGQIDTAFWADINSMTADETLNGGEAYYAISTDNHTTWNVAKTGEGVRPIVRNNAGTWEYNSNGAYGLETWTAATTNDELSALQEALEESQFNRMGSTQLAAIQDGEHFTLGDTLDLAVVLRTTDSGSIPVSDGVTINYDAEALNQGAVLGTDYNFDFPASDTVRVTSLAAQNLKVRVV